MSSERQGFKAGTRTRELLRKPEVSDEELNELGYRIEENGKTLCERVLNRKFDRLEGRVSVTEIYSGVLQKIHRYWRVYENTGELTAAIFHFAEQVLTDKVREKEERAFERSQSVEDLQNKGHEAASKSDETEKGMVQEEELRAVFVMLKRMKENRLDQAVVVALRLLDMGTKEISEYLNVPDRTVRYRMEKASAYIKENMQADWFE